jgi:hypothetical protein
MEWLIVEIAIALFAGKVSTTITNDTNLRGNIFVWLIVCMCLCMFVASTATYLTQHFINEELANPGLFILTFLGSSISCIIAWQLFGKNISYSTWAKHILIFTLLLFCSISINSLLLSETVALVMIGIHVVFILLFFLWYKITSNRGGVVNVTIMLFLPLQTLRYAMMLSAGSY